MAAGRVAAAPVGTSGWTTYLNCKLTAATHHSILQRLKNAHTVLLFTDILLEKLQEMEVPKSKMNLPTTVLVVERNLGKNKRHPQGTYAHH